MEYANNPTATNCNEYNIRFAVLSPMTIGSLVMNLRYDSFFFLLACNVFDGRLNVVNLEDNRLQTLNGVIPRFLG